MGNINRGEEEPTSTPDTPVPRQIADHILSSHSSHSSLGEERKQVTVLFADVAGFTSLSERLDPEEVRDLIRPAMDIMVEEIHTYEGTVAQFTGDGLMALFGAPLAHEDAPHRALYAALAMQARLAEYGEKLKPMGIELSIRVGINTGLVIVGSIGDDLAMEYTALGDTVNLASRMESAADPGTVQITDSTYRLTEGYFDFSDLGEIEVKGKEQSIHVYRVLGVLPTKGRVTAPLSRGLSPFVGREKELDQLTDRYAQSKQSQGQVVGIVGEPGVGKSRLLLQFRELLPRDEYTYLEGGCIHYGEAIAYLPILGILREYFDIQEGEEENTCKEKMDHMLSSLNGQLSHILPPLQELLSLTVDDQPYLSLEPAQRRERVFEAVRYLLMAESQKRPLILAIEDLHWIDKTSEEFLSYFVEGLGSARILLILLHRLEYAASWTGKSYYSQVRVDHLPQEPSTELVEAILAEGEISSEISDFIVTRTAGNPLFIEELTRGLLEAGSILKDNEHYILSTSDIQVPDTIQGIIASRLDRLTEDLKETMQVASVIGREFSLSLLEHVTGLSKPLKPSLMQLQSLEFIYEKTLFPEPEYIFKHALTQEVAYNSLLLKKRKEIHGRIAQAIEELYPDRLEDFYETLAYHFFRSEDTEKALHYLKLSGDKAAHDYSNWESMRFYKEAIQILDTRPETAKSKRDKLKLYLSITDTLPFLNFPEGSIETFEAAERLAEEIGDTESQAKAYGWLSRFYVYKGNMPLAFDYSGKCFTAAERVGDINSMAEVATNICAVRFFACRFVETVDISRRVIRLLEEQHREKDLFMGGWSVFSYLSAYCGSSLWFLGEFEEGKAQLARGFENALEINDRMGMAWVEIMQCNVSLWSGDVSLVDHARNAIQCFEEIKVEILLGFAWSFLGAGYNLLGERETARDHAEKGLKLSREYGMVVTVPFSLWISAFVFLALGDLESARECGEEGLRLSRGYGTRLYDGVLLAILGRIVGDADPSRMEVAEEYIRQGISMGDELKMRVVSAIGYLFLGEIFETAGRKEKATENLKKAEQMYKEMGVASNSYWLTRTREALARLG